MAPPGERDAEVARLTELGDGARRAWGRRGGPPVWTTLTDPEGNEFCVAEHRAEPVRNVGRVDTVGRSVSQPTTFDPHALLAGARLGVLATIKADGRPQLSPVTPFYDRDADVLYVSMTEGRAKTANSAPDSARRTGGH